MPELQFPDNAVETIAYYVDEDPSFDFIFRRPLRPSDPNKSIGLYPALWTPEEYEIGQYDPAITRYSVQIQTLAKNATEEDGILAHSFLAKRIRVMLYRDTDLIVQLRSLKTEDDTLTERMQRWGVTSQNYLANEVEGQFLFLAVTDLWLETEIV